MPDQVRGVALLGQGVIADAAAVELGRVAAIEGVTQAQLTLPGRWDTLVTVSDAWDLRLQSAGQEACRNLGVPWLPVHTELDTVVIGPVTFPSRPGCPQCLALRRHNCHPLGAVRAEIRRMHADVLASRASAMLTPLAAGLTATLAAAELEAHKPDEPSRSALFLRLDGLTVERHRFLPEPLCPFCGGLPPDSRENATITMAPRPKPAPTRYRLRPITDGGADLVAAYASPESGLIHSVSHAEQGGLVVAEAPITLRAPAVSVPGGGRSWDRRTSEVTAVLEALERYGGPNPGGKRTVIRAALAELDQPGLDPRTLGGHEDQLYTSQPGAFRRFTKDTVCNWVWGFSLTRSSPILVPESCAYFWTHGRPDPPFLYDTTSGCALGSCLEEAVLHGILEVAERDALLLTWHARIPAPAVDLTACPDRRPALTAAAITQATGYRVTVFDTTTETGIPCVWALATHPQLARGQLPPGSGQLATFSAAGSHLTPERAACSALAELGPQLADAIDRMPGRRADAQAFLFHPDRVKTIFDHAVAFADPRAYRRLDFLTHQPDPPHPLSAIGRNLNDFTHQDLRDDLLAVVDRYRAQDMEVIVVDQTTPEHRVQGLACVKVLIPGTLPLTYGHHRRRLKDLPRLLTLPYRLGHTSRPLAPADLNILPHPFAA
jgi:ribosomal protein S12 methylthiotransferase accessory factor